jgi:hypothetical protein
MPMGKMTETATKIEKELENIREGLTIKYAETASQIESRLDLMDKRIPWKWMIAGIAVTILIGYMVL